MRYKFNSQMNLFSPIMRSAIVKELKGISDIRRFRQNATGGYGNK